MTIRFVITDMHCFVADRLLPISQSFHEQGFAATQVFERAGPSMYFLSHGFPTHAKCRTAYQSQTPCTTTAVSDMASYDVCQTSDLLRSLGDLSDREGYDFDQLFAIAKVQVCIFPRSLTVHMAWARRLRLRPSSRVFFTQLGSNSDRYTRIWPLSETGPRGPSIFLRAQY